MGARPASYRKNQVVSQELINSLPNAKDKAKLENALQENSEFHNSYAASSATASLIKHIEATEPFRKAYADNPQAAVAIYGYLIGKEWDFDMFFENGEVSFTVE